MCATPASYTSAQGVQQEDGIAGAGLCVGIHPEVKQLDAEVSVHRGAARFDMDDWYVVGPPAAVFLAVLRFAANLRPLGLELQIGKSEGYWSAGVASEPRSRPQGLPLGQCCDEGGNVLGMV